MTGLKVLGAYGGKYTDKHTTCFRVSDSVVIDAGNLVGGLGGNAWKLRHIFLTHSHLDHIVDIPFLIDSVFDQLDESITIYGLKETIEALQEHLLNGKLWPDFSKIMLPGTQTPAIVFRIIDYEDTYLIGEHAITPVWADHVVPTCGYIVTCEKGALMVSGDTYLHPIVSDRIASEAGVNALVLEVSFPNRLDEIARQSKHLTPRLVAELLEGLPRQDIRIYFYHMKPDYKVEIAVELAQTLNRHYDWVLLDDGDTVPYCFS